MTAQDHFMQRKDTTAEHKEAFMRLIATARVKETTQLAPQLPAFEHDYNDEESDENFADTVEYLCDVNL